MQIFKYLKNTGINMVMHIILDDETEMQFKLYCARNKRKFSDEGNKIVKKYLETIDDGTTGKTQ